MKGKVSAAGEAISGRNQIERPENSARMAANRKREKKEIKFYSLENFVVVSKDS